MHVSKLKQIYIISIALWLAGFTLLSTGQIDSRAIPTILNTLLTTLALFPGFLGIFIPLIVERLPQDNAIEKVRKIRKLFWGQVAPLLLLLLLMIFVYTALAFSNNELIRDASFGLGTLLFYAGLVSLIRGVANVFKELV